MATPEFPKLKDLDLTKDEIDRLQDAFKKEEFRKLFFEYAQEISDPKNRAIYEEEIRKMEGERGMDVKFVNPSPGYVLKGTISGSESKLFINICTNENVDKPTCKSESKNDGRRGLMWSIPHSFSPVRDDFDRRKKKCQVVDVVFHPDTLHMTTTNTAFKKMIEDTAVQGIEKQFSITLDKDSVRHLKNIEFKGTPQATMIRTKNDNHAGEYSSETKLTELQKDLENIKNSGTKNKETDKTQKKIAETKSKPSPTVPKYTIVHQSEMDYQHYTVSSDNAPKSTRPKNLVITIELPLLSSAKTIDLDVFENNLTLKCETPAEYLLNIDLPFPIDDSNSSAKFDKTKHHLVVTLPVIKPVLQLDFENEKSENNQSLVEETNSESISEQESKNQSLPKMNRPEDENLEQNENSTSKIDNTKTQQDQKETIVKYLLPEFDYQQDHETISLVINVKNVSEDSISTTSSLHESRQIIRLCFVSIGSGGFPVHYSLTIKMEEGMSIALEETSTDVTDDNFVVVFLKKKECRQTLWRHIDVGLNAENLEEKTFPTEDTLKQEYNDLTALCQPPPSEAGAIAQPSQDAEAAPASENDRVPPLLLAEEADETKEKLVFQIGNGSGRIEEADWEADTEDQDCISPRIEVVHKHKVPNLHGILKQRSISESSLEDSVRSVGRENSSENGMELSPRSLESESDPDRSLLKRSVSFSEHIDTTTFKSNAAVTTMTVTLKSKRRRQRKRERRQQAQRHRHHSTGSEYSSDDYEHKAGSEFSEDGDDAFIGASSDQAEGGKCDDNALVEEKNKTNLDKDLEMGASASDHQKSAKKRTDTKAKSVVVEKKKEKSKNETEGEASKADTLLSWEENSEANSSAAHKTQCAFQFANSVMFDLDIE